MRVLTSTLVAGLTASVFLTGGCGEAPDDWQDATPGHLKWEAVEIPESDAIPEAIPELVAQGERLYNVRCAVCHGHELDGQGPASQFLGVKPRDFTKGIFKFRSLSTTGLPTDEDLFRTVTVGFPSHGMPSFSYLSATDRWALVHFTKTGSERFAQDRPRSPVDPGPAPKPSEALLVQGREMFEKAQCGMCHGEDGRGFGPSAAELTDTWDDPIATLDLASPAIYYKRGARSEDVMDTLVSGIGGTPMPSYYESGLTLDELWSLARYVESLVGTRDRAPGH